MQVILKCWTQFKTFIVSRLLTAWNTTTLPWVSDRGNSCKLGTYSTQESTVVDNNNLVIIRSPVLAKFADDNFYPYMDVMADIHFYHNQAQSPTNQDKSRLETLIQDQGLSVICIDLCFPHIYIGWRDVILKTDLLDQLNPMSVESNDHMPKKQMGILLNCFQCRVYLETGYFAHAERCCKLAEEEVTPLHDSWVTGVFYYTKVLIELHNSKRHCNRDEILGGVLEIFQKSCQGFAADAGLNFCIKYFHLAAKILVLCIETDRLFHSTVVMKGDMFQDRASPLKMRLRKMMDNLEKLITYSKKSKMKYWPKTLESMREYIEQSINLLNINPTSEQKRIEKLKEQSMAYISVLIKHPTHEKTTKNPNNALFTVLRNAFQVPESTVNEHVDIERTMATERECNYHTMDSMSDIGDLSSDDPNKYESDCVM